MSHAPDSMMLKFARSNHLGIGKGGSVPLAWCAPITP